MDVTGWSRSSAAVGADMLDALRAAHAAGIVHRDLKPANVLLSGHRVIITDFGIAHRSGETTLSEPGELVGTPAFMAPEQAEHATTTPASDLWSLGATLFTAVEGRPPYTGPDFVTTFGMVQLAFTAHSGLIGVDTYGEVHLWNVLTHELVAQWSAIGS